LINTMVPVQRGICRGVLIILTSIIFIMAYLQDIGPMDIQIQVLHQAAIRSKETDCILGHH